MKKGESEMGICIKKKCIYLIIIGLLISLSSCGKDDPIRIGFVAGLSGRVADLGLPVETVLCWPWNRKMLRAVLMAER